MIKGINVTLKHKKKLILNDVSFHVVPGGMTIFVGPSGAGKTSILRCIANLYDSYEGTIACESQAVAKLTPQERAKKIGFVFQQFNLFPHLTVLENCMQPLLKVLGLSEEVAATKVMETLKRFNVAELAHSYPEQISGGQQQRVALARAVCMGPKILVFDEPSSALDPKSAQILVKIMHDLQQQGMTIVMSSHDMRLVNELQGSIYFVEEGRIIEHFSAKAESPAMMPARIKAFLAS